MKRVTQKKLDTLNIPKFCKRMNMTYKEVAAAIGCTDSQIGQVANGHSKLGYENLLKLVQLGATAEELFGAWIGREFKKRCYQEYSKEQGLFNATDPKSVVLAGLGQILADMKK